MLASMQGPRSRLEKIYLYSTLSLQHHREGHLPMWRQILEMIGFALVTGNGPGFYHLAGLYRRSIPWRDKCQHLGYRQFIKRVRKLNPYQYHMLQELSVVHLFLNQHLRSI